MVRVRGSSRRTGRLRGLHSPGRDPTKLRSLLNYTLSNLQVSLLPLVHWEEKKSKASVFNSSFLWCFCFSCVNRGLVAFTFKLCRAFTQLLTALIILMYSTFIKQKLLTDLFVLHWSSPPLGWGSRSLALTQSPPTEGCSGWSQTDTQKIFPQSWDCEVSPVLLRCLLPLLQGVGDVVDLPRLPVDLLSGLLVRRLLQGLQDDVLQVQIHSFLVDVHHLWDSVKDTHMQTRIIIRDFVCRTHASEHTKARTCLKSSSSSARRRSSICLLPASSASLRRRSLSASRAKAWILRSSCRWISSLDRVSNRCASSAPTTLAWDASCWADWAERTGSRIGLVGVCQCMCMWTCLSVSPCAFARLFASSGTTQTLCPLCAAPAPGSAGRGRSSVPRWAPCDSPWP